MNSKEVFEKIESSITEALNKEDGIMLGGKKIEFYHYNESMNGSFYVRDDCLEVHVYRGEHSKRMWYVNVYNVLYEMTAVIYAIEELEKAFSEENPIISQNIEFDVENAFQIAITFYENQIMDS